MPANFVKLQSLDRLNDLFEQSHEKPVIFFKHSDTCGISSGVKQKVAALDADLNVVVVQTDRNISDAIAARTNIRHQSPQAIVIRNGRAVYHASHYDITATELERILNS